MLHDSVAELIDSNVLVLPASTQAQTARAQTQGGQMLVIMGADSYPCGLLTAAALAGLQDAGQALADVAEQWLVPTLTAPNTPLEVLVQGMLADSAIEWYAVMNGPQVIGVVGPQTIYQALTRLKAQPAPLAPVSELLQRIIDMVASAVPYTLSLPPGNPILPRAPICYRCPGGGAPHRVEQEQVHHSVSGIPLCPDHVGMRVIPVNPCGVI